MEQSLYTELVDNWVSYSKTNYRNCSKYKYVNMPDSVHIRASTARAKQMKNKKILSSLDTELTLYKKLL